MSDHETERRTGESRARWLERRIYLLTRDLASARSALAEREKEIASLAQAGIDVLDARDAVIAELVEALRPFGMAVDKHGTVRPHLVDGEHWRTAKALVGKYGGSRD